MGTHLTKPQRRLERDTGGVDRGRQLVGANPIPIPHPTNLALFGHKITLYNIHNTYNAQLMQAYHTNRWLILLQLQGCSYRSRGLSPPGPLTLTTGLTVVLVCTLHVTTRSGVSYSVNLVEIALKTYFMNVNKF